MHSPVGPVQVICALLHTYWPKRPCTKTIKLQESETHTPVTSGLVTKVILIAAAPLAMLLGTVWRHQKPNERARAPRIRVPNSERALFIVGAARFVGIVQRLSLTGGSAVLSKGSIPHGTIGDVSLNTVFGRVDAKIEFLQTGADGVAHAQAFRFIVMDDISSERFAAAARQMVRAGFSDAPEEEATAPPGTQSLNRLLDGVRRLAATLFAAKSSARS